MLHEGAKTRFLLKKLSKAIDICFSIRQGDPLAMILYIIYVEPLLVYIEKRIVGLSLPYTLSSQQIYKQGVEGYCDDLNVMTRSDNDFHIIDEGIIKFERVSGSILSRNQKCKVIGFGQWKNRVLWPLPYLQTTNEMKVFGIFIMNNVRSLVTRNWEFRFLKFQQSIISWNTRVLDTLVQRIEVVKIFALSRIYYVASILPLPQSYINKFEQAIGRFIWSGRLMRVAISELKLCPEKGGLGLTCIGSMGKSLLLTQLFRLLKSEDERSNAHIGYWLGEILVDMLPQRFLDNHAEITPSYFQQLADLVAESLMSGAVTNLNWTSITNQYMYRTCVAKFPLTRVEVDSGGNLSRVWKKLCLPVLDRYSREVLFLLVHDKLPLRERLFRIGIEKDPYCVSCIKEFECFSSDRQHVFLLCNTVSGLWENIRKIVDPLLPEYTSCFNLLTLNFPGGSFNNEITWLIGNYVNEVWKFKHGGGGNIDHDELFGFLKFKFRSDQNGARQKMQSLPNFA